MDYDPVPGQVKSPSNSENCCPFCKKVITSNDERNGNVNMFIGTECYHRFHISCFKVYAKKCLVTPK
jgi:hypothetical protein